MTGLLRAALHDLTQPDTRSAGKVRERATQVLRPAGALAALDSVAVHLAGWRATERPEVQHPAVMLFAADHGVAASGVSAYPSTITAVMLAAVRDGRATVNALARAVGATVSIHDVGVGRPTADIRVEAALDPDRFDDIVATAFAAVDAAAAAGADVLVLGELGIGNTTVAAALTSWFTGSDDSLTVGRGTGVDDAGLARKRVAVRTALERTAALGATDPLDMLRELGGAELVAMAAACVRARSHRIVVLLDGYVATAAMLAIHRAAPGVLDHCLAGHVSAEPGHRIALEHVGLHPLLALDLRLGEGTGALAALPLLQIACRAVTEVATFDEWSALR